MTFYPRTIAGVILWLFAAASVFAGGVERRIQTPEGERIYIHSEALPGESPAPVLLFLHGNEQAGLDMVRGYYGQWEKALRERGWNLVLPWNAGEFSFTSDEGVHAIRDILNDFCSRNAVDRSRIFVVGHGDGAPAVFYALSRIPDQFAAGLAIGGDMAKVIDSNRFFAGNSAAIPILWIYEEERLRLLQQTINRLQQAGLNLSLQAANEFTVNEAITWLSPHRAERLPIRVDYETGSSHFSGAYWVRIRDFDFALKNDALDSTRVDPGTGAFLRLGGFGYDPDGKGPGLAVKWLPEKYKGPLQREDVIVSIAGTMIEDARHYADFMEQQRESRDVGIILLRNGKSQRIETRIVIPHRDEAETARVHAEYLEDSKEVMLVSRGVKSLEVEIPKEWAPAKFSWNGLDLTPLATAGCWTIEDGKPEATRGCAAVPLGQVPAAKQSDGKPRTEKPTGSKVGAR